MDRHKIQLVIYMLIYCILISGGIIGLFYPWRMIGTEIVLLGVETAGFWALIGLSSMIASFILYLFQIWLGNKVLKTIGFYLGIGGSIESSVFGFFGFYYFYNAIRYLSVFCIGSICSGVLYLTSMVFCGLIYIQMCTIADKDIDEEVIIID